MIKSVFKIQTIFLMFVSTAIAQNPEGDVMNVATKLQGNAEITMAQKVAFIRRYLEQQNAVVLNKVGRYYGVVVPSFAENILNPNQKNRSMRDCLTGAAAKRQARINIRLQKVSDSIRKKQPSCIQSRAQASRVAGSTENAASRSAQMINLARRILSRVQQ